MKTSFRLLLCCLTLILALGAALAAPSRQPARKKLLEYGWDVPTPEYVAQHIRAMERKPFDGVIMRLKAGGNIFAGGKWDPKSCEGDFKALRKIRWGKFTDNFIMIYSASEMDWFSDKDWDGILSNLRLMTKAAKLGRCNLAFDAEPYGKNPWAYTEQKWASTKSYDEYSAVAFRRGQQFITTLQADMPRATIVTLFTYSLFREAMGVVDPAKRQQAVSQHSYSLYLPFLNGMLTAMGPGVTLTDGNEPSYYYPDSESFFSVYHAMRQGALNLIPKELVAKFQTQTQASQALYMDYVFAKVPWKGIPALWMTPEEQAKWFQHNVYYALKTADEYVWLYSEKMSWWEDKDIPAGMEEAIVKARAAIAAGQPLGFSMTDLIKRVEEKKQREIAEKLIRRRAELPRLAAAPKIDGDVSDAAWQGAAKLDPFIPTFGNNPADLKAASNARAAWDADKLYLSVVCDEPLGAPEATGEKRDDPVWMADSLDLFLMADTDQYYHFILSPKNVQWDALFNTDNDMTWDPKWQSATKIGAKSWQVEIAIPWAELKLKPAAGLTLRANLCRQRRGGGELSSWSQVLHGFMEPAQFGTWVLK